MEDILDIYEMPYDPERRLYAWMKNHTSCLGNNGTVANASSNDQKVDSEYTRNGTCSIFAFVEPLVGKHHVGVRGIEQRQTGQEIKYLVDVMYPEAEKIILVMDNLNTHKPASLYKVPGGGSTAHHKKRLEIHIYAQAWGAGDIAEIGNNVMTRQSLSHRIGDIHALRELSAWEAERNKAAAKVNWQFKTTDARIKPPKSLYPKFTTASE